MHRGVNFLLRTQRYDGSWKDEHWTGTGFPKVFYLRYHLYATYFPLWALALFKRYAGAERPAAVREAPRSAPRATPVRVRVRPVEE